MSDRLVCILIKHSFSNFSEVPHFSLKTPIEDIGFKITHLEIASAERCLRIPLPPPKKKNSPTTELVNYCWIETKAFTNFKKEYAFTSLCTVTAVFILSNSYHLLSIVIIL